MADITDDDYKNALQTIADKEKSVVEQTKTIVDDLMTEMKQAIADLDSIRMSLPTVLGVSSNGKTTVDSAYGQINSFYTQLGYLQNNTNSTYNNYNPAGTVPATSSSTSPTATALNPSGA